MKKFFSQAKIFNSIIKIALKNLKIKIKYFLFYLIQKKKI